MQARAKRTPRPSPKTSSSRQAAAMTVNYEAASTRLLAGAGGLFKLWLRITRILDVQDKHASGQARRIGHLEARTGRNARD